MIPTCGASGLELQASESNHVLRILMHMVCLCSRCSETVHAMDMEITPLDRAKINVANVVPVLSDNPVVLGAPAFTQAHQAEGV